MYRVKVQEQVVDQCFTQAKAERLADGWGDRADNMPITIERELINGIWVEVKPRQNCEVSEGGSPPF